LSPEAPVPVFLKARKKQRPGMASNVRENLANMTSAVIDFFSNPPEQIQKIRFVDSKSNQHILRYDIEDSVEPLKVSNLPNKVYDAVIVSDYNKGFITPSTAEELKQKYKCQIFVDTKKSDLSPFKGCIVKLNERESGLAYKKEGVFLIETLGSKGAKAGGTTFPVEAVSVHDVCGAGDVFLAALVAKWMECKDIDSAIRLANKCAALSVTKPGTYSLSRREYENSDTD